MRLIIFFVVFIFNSIVDVDPLPNRKSSKSGVERMLEFGRELFQMGQRLEKENGANETNRRMLEVCYSALMKSTKKNPESNETNFFYILYFFVLLQDAFSLLAYSNPWSSPLGWQLCPSRREIVCAALNSAILGSHIRNI